MLLKSPCFELQSKDCYEKIYLGATLIFVLVKPSLLYLLSAFALPVFSVILSSFLRDP